MADAMRSVFQLSAFATLVLDTASRGPAPPAAKAFSFLRGEKVSDKTLRWFVSFERRGNRFLYLPELRKTKGSLDASTALHLLQIQFRYTAV